MSEDFPQDDPSQVQPPQEGLIELQSVGQPVPASPGEQPTAEDTHIDIRDDGQPQELAHDTDSDSQADTRENDVNKAWDMAHDEKYAREGKTELLREPKKGELMTISRSKVVDDLYKAYLNGEHVTVDFNGEPMNSREIGELGIDGAYEKYLGYDKESYKELERLEEAARSANYDIKRFELEYKAKKEVPKLVEQSADLINPDTSGEWRECLEARALDWYNGKDSRLAIDLMKAHSQGATQEELQRFYEQQGTSGAAQGMIMAMIKHFYKQGDSLVGALNG
jgi:hypothetical protein